MRLSVRARGRRSLFWTLVAALLVLHVLPPRGGPEPLVLGVFPFDLAVQLVWMFVAALAVVWMTSLALWPDREDDAP
jgi:hypothetical protein